MNRFVLSWSHSPERRARWPPPDETDSEQTRTRYGSRSCLSVNRPLPLVRARTRFSSLRSTGRPRSEYRTPVTSAWRIGVPCGPTTRPVIVPFVRGGLGRLTWAGFAATGRPSRSSGGAL